MVVTATTALRARRGSAKVTPSPMQGLRDGVKSAALRCRFTTSGAAMRPFAIARRGSAPVVRSAGLHSSEAASREGPRNAAMAPTIYARAKTAYRGGYPQ